MIASVAVTPATSLVVAITSVGVTIASTFELSPLAVFLAWQKRLHSHKAKGHRSGEGVVRLSLFMGHQHQHR